VSQWQKPEDDADRARARPGRGVPAEDDPWATRPSGGPSPWARPERSSPGEPDDPDGRPGGGVRPPAGEHGSPARESPRASGSLPPTRRQPEEPDWGSPGGTGGSSGWDDEEPPWEPGAAVEPGGYRPWRWWVAGFVVLVLILLGVADRLTAQLAATEMVNQVQKTQALPTKPEASVGGFPFVTQVLTGNYKDIGLRIRRVAASGVCVDDIDVHAKGVHLPLTKLIGGGITTVPIDRIVGSVRLTYADLNAYLATRPGNVRLDAAAGNGMRVSTPIDVPFVGQVSIFGDVSLTVQNNEITIVPTGIGIQGLGALAIPRNAAKALSVTLPLSGLPLSLRLTQAKTTSKGIEVTAEADHLRLDATQTTPTTLRGC
jgi:hypothetical protein